MYKRRILFYYTLYLVYFELNYQYYKKAAKEGNADAIYKYASLIICNDNNKDDIDESIKVSKKACDKGHMDSRFLYGMIFLKGEILPTDQKKAARYFRIAADNGQIDSMVQYGFMLSNGEGVAINKAEAVKYYKIAINKGNSKAMHDYANLLYSGDGDILISENLVGKLALIALTIIRIFIEFFSMNYKWENLNRVFQIFRLVFKFECFIQFPFNFLRQTCKVVVSRALKDFKVSYFQKNILMVVYHMNLGFFILQFLFGRKLVNIILEKFLHIFTLVI